jgi:hypothetical protein
VVSGSGVGDFAGCGRGVFSGSSADFFFAADFFLADVVFEFAFFFADFDLGLADADFNGLAEGFGRGVASSSSESAEAAGDLVFAGELFFVFEGVDSPDFDFALAGVFDGSGEGLFFFLGDAVGVGEADLEWRSLGVSSSATWPGKNDASSALSIRTVAMQRRKRATSAHRKQGR